MPSKHHTNGSVSQPLLYISTQSWAFCDSNRKQTKTRSPRVIAILQTSRLCLKTYYVVSEVTTDDLPQRFKGVSAGDVSGEGLAAERTEVRIPSSYHRHAPVTFQ